MGRGQEDAEGCKRLLEKAGGFGPLQERGTGPRMEDSWALVNYLISEEGWARPGVGTLRKECVCLPVS